MILVIKYKTFIFKRPSPLDNSEYNTLKWLFDQNPKQKIKNIGILLGVYEESFKDLFYDMRFSIYLLIVILGSILISLLLQLFGLIDISIDKTEISLALGFLLLFTNQIALFFSLITYMFFILAKTLYYRNLKKDIIKSEDYLQFRKKRRF